MSAEYQIIDGVSKESHSSRELAAFLARDGQLLLPMLDLITQGERAIDEVIDVMGRATIEAILRMSAEQVGPSPGRRRLRRNRKELPPHHGLPTTLDAQSSPRRITRNKRSQPSRCSTKENRITLD